MDSMSSSMPAMDMSTSMSMLSPSMSMTMTSRDARPTASSSMGGMGDMDMGGGKGPNACRISMLWNWYTIDACFIARSWQVRSAGAFAGSCIGVILLVIVLEFLRRAQREFDRHLRRSARAAPVHGGGGGGNGDQSSGEASVHKSGTVKSRFLGTSGAATTVPHLKPWQQAIRSVLYMLQFAVGYFVMLLAMYYNGYIIICIFIGAFLGAMIFQWDTYFTPS